MFTYARSIPRPAAARNEASCHQLRIPLFVFYTGKITASYYGAIQVRLQPTHEQYLSTDNLKEKVELTSSNTPALAHKEKIIRRKETSRKDLSVCSLYSTCLPHCISQAPTKSRQKHCGETTGMDSRHRSICWR